MSEQPAEYPDTVDVVVIGAGPGGSATATKLAQAGRSVLQLERRTHPRFHIGESMLPPLKAALEQLGLLDRVSQQGYVHKHGAEFSGSIDGYKRIPFTSQGPNRHQSTFQLERAHFDKLLADYAAECGVNLIEQAVVQELIEEDGRVVGVRYEHAGASHEVRAEYVVDAAGRSSKVAQAYKLRKQNDRFRMVAVFQHFSGVDEANNPGYEGDITIGAHKDGWVWTIPIWPEVMSVGAVMPRSVLQSGEPEHLLREHMGRTDRIVQRLAGTEPMGETRIETDYSYHSEKIAGNGWFMVGDAACFFDPIFSAGVLLAVTTGIKAAETIDEILSDSSRTDELQDWYTRFYKTGYDMYARLIFAYYEYDYNLVPILQAMGFVDNEDPTLAIALAQLVAGDFWSPDNPVNHFIRQQSRWDTFEPFEPVLECPFYPELAGSEKVASWSGS